MYDLLAGKENMESSYLMSKGKALELFPMLKSEGLVGAVVYYDGVSLSFARAFILHDSSSSKDNTMMHA